MNNHLPELGLMNDVTFGWTERGATKGNAKLLDRALELIAAVPYAVTLRWLFYGLWQEGWYSDVKTNHPI